MRLKAALLACSLALPAVADPRPPDGTRALKAVPARSTADVPPGLGSMVAEQIRVRANSLRKRGDYQAALDAVGLEQNERALHENRLPLASDRLNFRKRGF